MGRKEKGAPVYLLKPIDEKNLVVNVEYFLDKYMKYKKLMNKSD